MIKDSVSQFLFSCFNKKKIIFLKFGLFFTLWVLWSKRHPYPNLFCLFGTGSVRKYTRNFSCWVGFGWEQSLYRASEPTQLGLPWPPTSPVILPPRRPNMSPKLPVFLSVKPHGDTLKNEGQSSCRNIIWSTYGSPTLIGHFLGQSHFTIAYWFQLSWNECQPSAKHCVRYP